MKQNEMNTFIPHRPADEIEDSRYRCLTISMSILAVFTVLGITTAILLPIFLPANLTEYDILIVDLEQRTSALETALQQVRQTKPVRTYDTHSFELNQKTADLESSLKKLEKAVAECNCADDSGPSLLRSPFVPSDVIYNRAPEAGSGDGDLLIDDEEYGRQGLHGRNVECLVAPRPVCPDNCMNEVVDERGCTIPVCC